MGYDDENNNIPQPVLEYEPIRKADKRKKSQSRTRDKTNRSQARIILLDDSDIYIDMGV